MKINPAVESYLLTVVRTTREHPEIETGASPRGTIALMRAVQARAFLRGRAFAVPDDVRALAEPVLAHRLVLSVEASMRKTAVEVMKELLDSIEVPVEGVSSS